MNDELNYTIQTDGTNDHYFPPKPRIQEPPAGNPVRRLLFSMLLWVAVAFLFIGNKPFLIVALLVVIMTHEMGHFTAMLLFGYNRLQMLFIPMFGGAAMGSKQEVSEREKAIIILAGPLPGILIGSIILILHHKLQLHELWGMIGFYFIIINALNLLPLYPLDGGQLFYELFLKKYFSVYVAFAVISVALIMLVFSANLVVVVLIAYTIGRQLWHQFKARRFYQEMSKIGVDVSRTYDELDDRSFWLMYESLHLYEQRYSYIRPGYRAAEVVNGFELQAIINLLKTRITEKLSPAGKAVIFGLWLAGIALVLITDAITGSIGVLQLFDLTPTPDVIPGAV